MNSALNKIVVAAIDDQWNKGGKYIVMGWANKYFVELMYWIYLSYVQITPRDLMINQGKMKVTYSIEDPIEIPFD